MKMQNMNYIERVKEILNYDPETGSFTWKKGTAKYDRSGLKTGNTPDYRGYHYISFDKKDHLAQRLAWIIMNGEIPSGKITFKDGNKSNLKWDNITLNRGISGFDHQTPEGRSAYGKAWRAANPEKYKDKVLLSSFGIGLREYEQMIVAQKGKCAICEQVETLKRRGKDVALCVDHDHETGEVRSLLCSACNQGLGQFKDNQAFLRKAADYLEIHKQKKIPSTNVIPLKGK